MEIASLAEKCFVVLALLFFQFIVLICIAFGCNQLLLVKAEGRARHKRINLELDPDQDRARFRSKIDSMKGPVRRGFAFIAFGMMAINTNGVVTNVLHPSFDAYKYPGDWYWACFELFAFVVVLCGVYDARNTCSKLEYMVSYTQRAKQFSLMKFVTNFNPTRLLDRYKHYKLIRETDNNLCPEVCAIIACMQGVTLGLLGLISLTMKIRQVRFCAEMEPWNWTRVEFFLFLAFSNNVVGITDTGALKMDQILCLLFGGEDAEIIPEERGVATKVYNCIFDDIKSSANLTALDKLVIAVTFEAKDLQKIIVDEPDDDLDQGKDVYSPPTF